MQAVFLDKGTFSDGIDLPAPAGVSDYIIYDDTPKDKDTIIDRCKDADIIITNKVQTDSVNGYWHEQRRSRRLRQA